MKEKVFTATSEVTQKIELNYDGEAFEIKLDKKTSGSHKPLFHFLDDNGKPWSKRCDFVIFHLNQRINVHFVEFKSETLPVNKVLSQMESSVAWCRSLYSTINNYTNKRNRLNVRKFVLTSMGDPSAYLDTGGKYLSRDHSIRYYNYNDISGMQLEDLENTSVEHIG